MKVLLVGGVPVDHALHASDLAEWQGLDQYGYTLATGCLKAFALADPICAASTEVVLHDFRVALFQQSLQEKEIDTILAESPDVVGFSCRCWDLDVFLNTASLLKQRAPGLTIVLGGPSASFVSGEILAHHAAVDLVVEGEGEAAFLALCRSGFREQFESIAGLWYRDCDGQPRASAARRDGSSLGELPSPYLSGVLTPKRKTLYIEQSRGCRYRCAFCCYPNLVRGIHHVKPDRFLQEVRWARDHGYPSILLTESALNHDNEHLARTVNTLRQADPDGAVKIDSGLRWENLDETQYEILSHFRFNDITIGLESAHDPARKIWGKPSFQPAAFAAAMNRLVSQGHGVTISIVLGLPGDTPASFEQTLRYLETLHRDIPGLQTAISWLSVFPGSRFHRDREKHGLATAPLGRPFVVQTATAPWHDLVRMAECAVAWQELPGFRCEGFMALACDEQFDIKALLSGKPPLQRKTSIPQEKSASKPPPSLEAARLVAPWILGQNRLGWLFSDVLPRANREEGVRLVFLHDSFEVLVQVAPRRDARKVYSRTKHHDILYRSDSSSGVPRRDLNRLMQAVTRLIERNEVAVLGDEAP